MIVAGLAVILAVSACARPQQQPSQGAPGILQGHLYGVGGPPPGLHQPWPGTVTITGPGVNLHVAVAADGAYSATLASGRYVVVGHSPQFDDGKTVCRAVNDAQVSAGATATVDVLCQLR